MIRRPPRSTPIYSSAASVVYKRQPAGCSSPPQAHKPRTITAAKAVQSNFFFMSFLSFSFLIQKALSESNDSRRFRVSDFLSTFFDVNQRLYLFHGFFAFFVLYNGYLESSSVNTTFPRFLPFCRFPREAPCFFWWFCARKLSTYQFFFPFFSLLSRQTFKILYVIVSVSEKIFPPPDTKQCAPPAHF